MKKNFSNDGFFVTGTGTGVGKTFASACLAHFFVSNNFSTAVTKPFQTGIAQGDDDISVIKEAVPGLCQLPPELENVYRFKMPASPFLAGRTENSRIDISRIISTISEIKKTFSPDVLIIEGAGGLYVPVNEDIMMIDLIKMLGMPAILVCDSALGTINHTLLSIKALKSMQIECAGFIFNRTSENPEVIEKDNLETLKEISGIPFIGTIKKNSSMSKISPDIYSFPGLSKK
ncbi:MAG: dethiobiotin synthase [Lentisphaerae bacterium GWF2_45_14]|nr:MAG: dethiobiotin synthase [Lentisphaerae bacterium GWF2_45_14]